MLVLKMELWPHGVESQAETVAWATIINDGSGTPTSGNYDITLYNGKRRWKEGRLEGFPRKRRLGWDLLCRALFKMLGARNELWKEFEDQAITDGVEANVGATGSNE